MLKDLHHFVTKHRLFDNQTVLILGLSGGPDSVFLLDFLTQMVAQHKLKGIIAAHLDHQWRTNSADDVMFCAQLAEKYNVPFISSTLSNLNLTLRPNGSKEELGRIARRHFLEQVRSEYNADAIAVAHHRDDQQETFFIRLLRGASLAGLTAMKPRQGNYIRPLLELSKQEILDYLHTHNIPYVIDPTNESPEFLRNRIRSTVIPALRACDSRFDTTFGTTLNQLQDAQNYLEYQAQEFFTNLTIHKDGSYYIAISKLMALHPTIRKQIIMLWFIKEQVKFPVSTGFFEEFLHFLDQPGNKTHYIYTDWSITKNKDLAQIHKKRTCQAENNVKKVL